MQGGVKQRDGPGTCGARTYREPWDVEGNTQAQIGGLDIQLQAEVGFQGLFKQRRGERLDVLQAFVMPGLPYLRIPVGARQALECG